MKAKNGAEPHLIFDHQVAAHREDQGRPQIFEQLHQHLKPAPDQILV